MKILEPGGGDIYARDAPSLKATSQYHYVNVITNNEHVNVDPNNEYVNGAFIAMSEGRICDNRSWNNKEKVPRTMAL
jgi:hypothetical protein